MMTSISHRTRSPAARPTSSQPSAGLRRQSSVVSARMALATSASGIWPGPGSRRRDATGPQLPAVEGETFAHADESLTDCVIRRSRSLRPRPVSTISRTRESAEKATRTSARAGPACLIALVSASCTIRNETRSSAGGSERGSPSTLTCTGRPDARARSASVSSWASPGDVSLSRSASLRYSTPTIRRMSTNASRPQFSTERSASAAAAGSRRATARAAAVWITITLTLCATTSCSSRATRVRSSTTACRARSRCCCSRRSVSARSVAFNVVRLRTARPAPNGTAKKNAQTNSTSRTNVPPGLDVFGSPATTTTGSARSTVSIHPERRGLGRRPSA